MSLEKEYFVYYKLRKHAVIIIIQKLRKFKT